MAPVKKSPSPPASASARTVSRADAGGGEAGAAPSGVLSRRLFHGFSPEPGIRDNLFKQGIISVKNSVGAQMNSVKRVIYGAAALGVAVFLYGVLRVSGLYESPASRKPYVGWDVVGRREDEDPMFGLEAKLGGRVKVPKVPKIAPRSYVGEPGVVHFFRQSSDSKK